MKKIGLLLFLMSTLYLFAGCSDGPITFYHYDPSDYKINAYMDQHVSFQMNVDDKYDGSNYSFSIEGEKVSKKLSCKGYLYSQNVDIPIDANTFRPGDKFQIVMTIYSHDPTSRCRGEVVATYKTAEFTAVSATQISNNQANVISKLGGSSQYCNIDSNGNYRITTSDNLFIDVAYSQVGYKIKESSKNLDLCSDGNNHYNRNSKKLYSKYGETKNPSLLSLDFVNWVAGKAGVKLTKFDTIEKLISWAKKNNRYYSDPTKIHEGDLVVYPNGGLDFLRSEYSKLPIIGIVHLGYYSSDVQYRSIGLTTNDNYSITIGTGYIHELNEEKEYYKTDYISMKGLAY